MRFIIPLGLTILLAACGTTTNYYTQTVQSWKGESLNSLAKSWGRPDVQKNTPSGQKVYAYKTEGYSRTNAPTPPSAGIQINSQGKPVIIARENANTSWNQNGTTSCTAFFIADAKGTIIHVETAGNGCYGGASFANRMANPAKNPVNGEKKS